MLDLILSTGKLTSMCCYFNLRPPLVNIQNKLDVSELNFISKPDKYGQGNLCSTSPKSSARGGG